MKDNSLTMLPAMGGNGESGESRNFAGVKVLEVIL